MKAVSEAALPILQAPKLGSVVKFVPGEESVDSVGQLVGQLQVSSFLQQNIKISNNSEKIL